MDCAGCARSVERGVGSLPDIAACEISFPAGILEVRGAAPADEIVQRIQALGFGATPAESSDPEADDAEPPSLIPWLLGRRSSWPALAGAVLLLPGLIFHEILHWEALWIELPALVALLLAGGPVVRSGWRGLRINRELNIQALMTIAAVGAVVIGAWVEAGMVMVLFSLGEALEGFAADRARRAIRGLMTVAPDRALRLDPDGSTHEVAVDTLDPGDTIVVRPGERIPMDGVVRTGHSAVDESALTGESIPREKGEDDEVMAGAVNGEGALEVRVTRHASETTLHRMIRLMEEAQSRRAPTQRFIDRFARVYTPAVVVLAAAVAILPPLLLGAPFWNPDPDTFGWFYRSLALLVIACPCALVISVPVSVASALTNSARAGVLVKGGAHMEMLSRIRVVAFDKTGTLTEGALTVVGVESVDCHQTGTRLDDPDRVAAATHAARHHSDEPCEPCTELLAVAAAVEARSEHPVGRAVVGAARHRLPPERIPIATEHRALIGRGITAQLHGRTVTIGSPRHFGDVDERSLAAQESGKMPVLVTMDEERLGTITLSDIPRGSARRAVDRLHRMGIETILLSGDSEAAAAAVARQVGISRTEGDLLPQEKLSRVEALQAERGPVAMVGDGINDAPALAVADVGIAVGGGLGGTDQAREAAAVTLMRPDLETLPRTLRLARATMRTIRANVAFAIGIKVAFLALVLAGMGTLWMAVLADVGATIVVTLYGLRLLRWRDREGDEKSGDRALPTGPPPSSSSFRWRPTSM